MMCGGCGLIPEQARGLSPSALWLKLKQTDENPPKTQTIDEHEASAKSNILRSGGFVFVFVRKQQKFISGCDYWTCGQSLMRENKEFILRWFLGQHRPPVTTNWTPTQETAQCKVKHLEINSEVQSLHDYRTTVSVFNINANINCIYRTNLRFSTFVLPDSPTKTSCWDESQVMTLSSCSPVWNIQCRSRPWFSSSQTFKVQSGTVHPYWD